MPGGGEGLGTVAERRLKLPSGIDLVGRHDERPRLRHALAFAALVLAVLLWGIARLASGSVADGAFFLVVAIALVVVTVATASVLVGYLLRPHRAPQLTPAERHALRADPEGALAQQAPRVRRLGAPRGRPAADQPFAERSHRGDAETLSLIETNRVAEAHLTEEWLDAIVAPREVTLTAEDGCELAAHVFECALDSSRWAVLVHGYGGGWTDVMLYARHYAALGFNLLVPDLRAHGASGGRRPGLGWLDRTDLVEWCRWIVRNEDEGARIVLHGQGAGGAAACIAAGEKTLPSGVVACVCDSAYSDAWNGLARLLRAKGAPVHPTLDAIRAVYLLMPGGFDLALASAADAAAHAQVPLLLFQGERDAIVPPYMAKKIYDAASGAAAGDNRRLRMFRGAGHLESALVDPATYYHELRDLLKPLV